MPTQLDQGSVAHFQGAVREIGLAAKLPLAVAAVLPGLARFPPPVDAGRRRVGQSAGKVYPFLGGMPTSSTKCATKRPPMKSWLGSPRFDRRQDHHRPAALDLLELLVERRGIRSAEPTGPHADKAWPRWGGHFKREWSPGEPRLMADFLAGLGSTPRRARKEQLRQLEACTANGGRLVRPAAHRPAYAETLNGSSRSFRSHRCSPGGLEGVRGCQPRHPSHFGEQRPDNSIAFTDSAKQYDSGEKLLSRNSSTRFTPSRRNWLVERIQQPIPQGAAEQRRSFAREGKACTRRWSGRSSRI